MAFAKVIFMSLLLFFKLYANYTYGILTEITNANRLVFYTKYGYIDCFVYALATLDNIEQKECNITKKMKFFTTLYAQRELHLQQKYKLNISKGMCQINDASKIYGLELIKNGYGIFLDIAENMDIIQHNKYKKAQEHAKKHKKGLWFEWESTMKCAENQINTLSRTLKSAK